MVTVGWDTSALKVLMSTDGDKVCEGCCVSGGEDCSLIPDILMPLSVNVSFTSILGCGCNPRNGPIFYDSYKWIGETILNGSSFECVQTASPCVYEYNESVSSICAHFYGDDIGCGSITKSYYSDWVKITVTYTGTTIHILAIIHSDATAHIRQIISFDGTLIKAGPSPSDDQTWLSDTVNNSGSCSNCYSGTIIGGTYYATCGSGGTATITI